MIRRNIEDQLIQWIKRANRKPLIIRGARQVGKSTLVREWARHQGLKLAEINLERHPRLDSIFKTNDVSRILRELEVVVGHSLALPDVVLFLDEIQAAPNAFPALRYFYEERPELPVVAAGSLLEFVLANHHFSMPVGRVEYLHCGPLTFTEFLRALGEEFLIQSMFEFCPEKDIPVMAHERLLERQREFLFVGGMPECVALYQKNQSPLEVRAVHRSIIQTYQDDFSKYNQKENFFLLLQNIIDVLPKVLGQKVKYVTLSPHHRSADVKLAVDMLIKARLILPCYHTDCSGVPLKARKDGHIYKLYFLDVGLFNYLCGLEWPDVSKLSHRELINEGGVAEQFIAQHLAYGHSGLEPPELFYWLRESRSQNAEVDFVTSFSQQIIPIEVKAGKSGSLKSLQQLMNQKKFQIALRFDLNPPSFQKVSHKLTGPTEGGQTVAFDLVSWPLYLVERVCDFKKFYT